ncbi:MAG: DNA gyrase/topoisomerase IV subunit A [Tidjanibacter sp.]|nr:DNA gyrase/topoisomerase IV subunit A [Tidjanibacter sp.]
MSNKNDNTGQGEEYLDDQDNLLDEDLSSDEGDDQMEQEYAPVSVKKLSDKYLRLMGEEGKPRTRLMGMFRDWYLDYASYVILERAVPEIDDGLKPVQRRILHSMRRIDDGRYNKVANIIGQTMQFHPHGDASIGDALVQLGQKDILIDCQGNWGNLLTGDGAAAARYIEARLSKFALDVVFNPKTTEWMLSYDGRNNEPVTLPVKFPLLLAQGVEGIAVGLASKILPHNFNELIDASIACLKGEEFELYPDFPTGGLADCSRYNDGIRGGVVKVRARIVKEDKNTLVITEIPFGTTTETIKDSIVKANEKGKIKIKKVDDNTAAKVEIVVHVAPGESVDKTIDALYAFTLCEQSVSPNSCVISGDRPHFIGVTEILRHNTDRTRYLLGRELEIRLAELDTEWHNCSLEKIFINNKLYQLLEGRGRDEAYEAVDKGLEPFKHLLRREVTHDDVVRLTELKFIRITKFDSDKADNQIRSIENEEREVRHNLDHLTDYAIAYFEQIKAKYGAGRERRTELRAFDQIEVAKVAVANAKLYVDRAGGFFGYGNGLKQFEYVSDCSDLDDVIVFAEDGSYIITRIKDKDFFAPNIVSIGVFQRGDERTIYNVLYRDGDKGRSMVKRCSITSITRDKVYNITKGTPGSRILYMSVNPNGEAETLKIIFRQRAKLKKSIVDLDFSTVMIKGRASQGNIFSRYPIHKIMLKSRGASTLAGQNIWYDPDIQRLNADAHGVLLGEFEGDDKIIVFTAKDQYYTTGYDVGHHFPEDTVKVEKYDPERVYSVAYLDGAQQRYYLKRFVAEQSDRMVSFVDETTSGSVSVAMTDDRAPLLEVVFGGANVARPSETIDATEFIAVKSHRAKGKRISNFDVATLRFVPSAASTVLAAESAPDAPDDSDDDVTDEGHDEHLPVSVVTAEGVEQMVAIESDREAGEVESEEVDASEAEPETGAEPEPEPIAEPIAEPEPAPRRTRQPRTASVTEPVAEPEPAPSVEQTHTAPAEPQTEPSAPVEPVAPVEPDEEPLEKVDNSDVELEIVVPVEEDDSRNPKIKQLDLF